MNELINSTLNKTGPRTQKRSNEPVQREGDRCAHPVSATVSTKTVEILICVQKANPSNTASTASQVHLPTDRLLMFASNPAVNSDTHCFHACAYLSF